MDHGLFEALRGLRKELAEQRRVPPYVIFSDATLRELARVRPSSLEKMRFIYGIGATKLADFGGRFLQVLHRQCEAHGLSRDEARTPSHGMEVQDSATQPSRQRRAAFDLFGQGMSLDEVARRTERSRNTVLQYLVEFIQKERPASISAWVRETIYEQVATAARRVGLDRLKPIYLELGERIAYDDIRIVRAHLVARQAV